MLLTPIMRSSLAGTLAAAGFVFASLAAGQAAAGPEGQRVILLKPVVRYERLQDGGEMSGPPRDVEAYAARLESRAAAAVAGQGLRVFEPPDGAFPTDALEQLGSQAGKLARGVLAGDAKTSLARVAAACGDCLILVQYMKKKVGPRGTWNPTTGAITSRMDSLLIQASLISTRTGETVWKNEAFLRELPRPEQDKLLKTIGILFATFKAQ